MSERRGLTGKRWLLAVRLNSAGVVAKTVFCLMWDGHGSIDISEEPACSMPEIKWIVSLADGHVIDGCSAVRDKGRLVR